jgi:hypothetical protein
MTATSQIHEYIHNQLETMNTCWKVDRRNREPGPLHIADPDRRMHEDRVEAAKSSFSAATYFAG